MTSDNFKVWEGIYASFNEAPTVGPGFAGSTWGERSIEAARDAAAKLAAGETIDYSLRQRNQLLPIVVAMLVTQQSHVSVLDFGGGLGAGFTVLANAVGNHIACVDYRIVEVESICRTGRALYAAGTGPTFNSEIPSAGTFDVVHTSSVIQYIEDWRGLLRRLARLGAPYLSFGDVFIGGIPTYVTLQNYYESQIRHWFINAAEFIGEVERQGYELALRTACDVKVLDAYGPLPMINFPPALRIPHTSHLLFGKA